MTYKRDKPWDRTFHTKVEKSIIEDLGGTPLKKKGYDGILNGKPVEVRTYKKQRTPRFKIDKGQHDKLLDLNGNYIFVDVPNKRHKIITARKVDKLLDENGHGWLTDKHDGKNWLHEYLWRNQVFE